MGQCAFTLKKKSAVSPFGKGSIVDINLSGSYATGGDTVSRATLKALGVLVGNRLSALILQAGASSPAGHAIEVINGASEYVDPLLRVRDVATGAEIANATNLSAQSIRALIISSPYR